MKQIKDGFWKTAKQSNTYDPFYEGMTNRRIVCKIKFGNDIKIRRFRRFKAANGAVRFTAEIEL